MIATTTQSVVAELRMVPNQPLTFTGDPTRSRSEDALLAYSWDRYLKTGDPTWVGQLPMTKSAVRAMDTVVSFCKGKGTVITDFVVGGASKRGWTTWLTAAVDKRVVAIVPIVIDILNVEQSMRHHHAAYGFWAPAIHDYVEMGFTEKLGTEAARKLFAFVDPFAYRDRLTMPKYIINSSGDQFFLPDSSQFYFGDLKAEKHIRYVPNTDHSLGDSNAWQGLMAFYGAVLTKQPRPRFSWKARDDGALEIRTTDTPTTVTLWQATNPKARDFRLESIGKAWKSTPLPPVEKGTYRASVRKPAQGWTAFFAELTFPGAPGLPFLFSTEVRVVGAAAKE